MKNKQYNLYGRQPALRVMASKRWTIAAAAREIGIEYHLLHATLVGRTTPSPHIRNALSNLLGTPLEYLFTAEALVAKYRAHQPYPPRRKPGAKS